MLVANTLEFNQVLMYSREDSSLSLGTGLYPIVPRLLERELVVPTDIVACRFKRWPLCLLPPPLPNSESSKVLLPYC